MSIRIRFDITWTMNAGVVPGTWFKPEDHEAFLEQQLVAPFAAYDSALRSRSRDLEGGRIEIRALFDVTLGAAHGAWGRPESHKLHIEKLLTGLFAAYAPEVEVQIWRQADFREAVDHGEIMLHYGADATSDDYPVFRPEPHPDWEEADEVFLQDGSWFWCLSDEAAEAARAEDPFASFGPSAGPEPEAIYTPWEPGFEARRFAAAA